MRFFMIVSFLTFGFIVNAQKVSVEGVNYVVKGEKIFKNGVDVSTSLSLEEKQKVSRILLENEAKLQEAEKVEKALKKADKSQKKAEKKQKKAEKVLKQKEKAQAKYKKTEKKYKTALSKYENLKKKGKLSPEDEKKWLDKIEKYKESYTKAKRKM